MIFSLEPAMALLMLLMFIALLVNLPIYSDIKIEPILNKTYETDITAVEYSMYYYNETNYQIYKDNKIYEIMKDKIRD